MPDRARTRKLACHLRHAFAVFLALVFLATAGSPPAYGQTAGGGTTAQQTSIPNTTAAPAPAQPPVVHSGALALPAHAVLNLGSLSHIFPSPSATPVHLILGGQATTIAPGQQITAAEYLAIGQVLVSPSHTQTLLLNSQGEAIGGYARLTPAQVDSNLQSLVLPSHVSLGAVGFTTGSPLNVAGSATVAGSLFALQTQVGQASVLNMGSLTVLPGGLISGYVPASAPAGHAVASAGLAINAGGVVNQGSIATPGALTVNAGGSITSSGSMKASGDVSLTAGSGLVTNSGLISAQAGNVYFNAPQATDIRVNNQGGTVQALVGNINVRDAGYNGSANLTLTGGNWLSGELNLNTGQGTATANVDQATGTVNVTAAQVHLSARTTDLTLGNMTISGDPTFYNNAGSVTLSGSLTFSGQDLAIVASQDITAASGTTISTAAAGSGNGGNITMIAGAANDFGNPFATTGPSSSGANPDSTSSIAIQGPSNTGGAIQLAGVTTFSSAGGGASGNGGNVTMIAFPGTSSTSGTVSVPSTIVTSGSGAGSNGNVLIIAGAGFNGAATSTSNPYPATPTQAVTLAGITATGGSGGGGSVTVAAAQPSLVGNNGYVAITNGTVQPGSDSFAYVNVYAGKVTFQGSVTANQLTVVAGNNIGLDGAVTANSGISLTTYGSGTIGGAGTLNSTGPIALTFGNNPIYIGTSSGLITVTQGTTSPTVLTIGTAQNSLSSLSIAAPSDMTVSNNITVGGAASGALSLDTTANNPYGNNINLNASITANAGITLTVGGAGTIGGSGTVNSVGAIALNLGAQPVALGTVSSVLTVTQGASTTLSIGTAPNSISSLAITTGGNITTTSDIALGNSGALSLATTSGSGSIDLEHSLTANLGITLSTTGTGTIGGPGSINSKGPIAVNLGTGTATLSATASSTTIGQGTAATLTIGALPSAISSLTVNSAGSINVASPINLTDGSLTLGITSGAGTIGGSGSVFASSGIGLTLGALGGAVLSSTSSGKLTVVQGTASLTITSPTQVGSLTINSPESITVSNAVNLGNASLSLISSAAGNNITLNGNLTANGGIALTVSGTGIISGAHGTVDSTGPITLNLGSDAASLSVNNSLITVTQGGAASVSIGTTPASISSLSVSSAGNLTIPGNISVNGNMTLSVSGSNTITGTGTIAATTLTVNMGTSGSSTLATSVQQLASTSSGASLTINQTGSLQLNANNEGSGTLSISTDKDSNIDVNGTVTANGGITLTALGGGTIGGSGVLNSTGAIALTPGTAGTTTLDMSSGNITVGQGTSPALRIGSPASLGSLTINSPTAISVTSAITIGGSFSGALTLNSTGADNNISLNGNSLTANGGVSLSVAGAGAIDGGGSGGTINSTGPIALSFGTNNVTISSASNLISIAQGGNSVTIGTPASSLSSLAVSAAGSITLSSAVNAGSADVALAITTGGTGTISSAGSSDSLTTTGNITLTLGSEPAGATTTTVDSLSGNIIVSQGTSSPITIAAPSSLASLTINSANSITTTANTVTVGGASTGFLALNSTTQGNTITLDGTLTANGGVALSVTGAGTILGAGSLSSAGSIAISLGTPNNGVSISQSSGNIVMSGGASTKFSTPAALSVSCACDITVGSLAVSNLSLSATGAGTIDSGASVISTTASGQGFLTLSYGQAVVLGTTSGGDFAVTAGGKTVVASSAPAEFTLNAPAVTINSNTAINAPAVFRIHTNNLFDSGTITSSQPDGLVVISNYGLSGGLALSGNGTASHPATITVTNGGNINILEYNGQTIAINSSYSMDPGDGGGVRIWEAVIPDASYPTFIDNPVYAPSSGALVNPNHGQITIANGVTLTLGSVPNSVAAESTYPSVAAPTITIGTTSGSGAVVQTMNASVLAIHTDNLIDNGTITSSAPGSALIEINDRGMNPLSQLTLSGHPQPITIADNPSNTGGSITIEDFYGQQININASYTLNSGGGATNTAGLTGIWESSLGGDATPAGTGPALESSHASGILVVAPGVTLTLTCQPEVELDVPTQIVGSGARIIATGGAQQLTIEANHLTNNGQIIDRVPNSLMGVANDDVGTPYATDADIQGTIRISGNGSFSFASGVPGTISIGNEGSGVPSLIHGVTFDGSQTFTVTPGSNSGITIQANSAITIGSGTTQAFSGSDVTFDAPATINNGAVTSATGNIIVQNSGATQASTLLVNNGSFSTSSINASINVTGPVTVTGTGTSPASGALIVGGTGGTFSVGGFHNSTFIEGGSAIPVAIFGAITAIAGGLSIESSNITINGKVESSVPGGVISLDNNTAATGGLTISANGGIVAYTGGASGAILINENNANQPINISGNLTLYAGTGSASVAGILATSNSGTTLTLENGASLSITAVNAAEGSLFAMPVITASGGSSTVSLTTADASADLLASLSVGTGTVSLIPIVASERILVGSSSAAAGSFNVTSGVLSSIAAGKLVIGSLSSTGGTVLSGSISLPSGTAGTTPGVYDLDFETGGSYSNPSSRSIDTAGNNLTINALGPVNTGGGTITAPVVSISGRSASGAGVTINGALTIDANTINFAATAAGPSAPPVLAVAGGATLSLTGTPNLTIPGAASISGTLTASGNLTLTVDGNLTTTGRISAGGGEIALNTGSGGNIALGGTIGGSTTAVVVHAAGNITQATPGTISGTSVSITSDSGNIGNTSTKSPNVVVTTTPALTVGASNQANLSDTAAGGVQINGLTTNTFQLKASSTITLGGAISAPNVSLTGTGANTSIALGYGVGTGAGAVVLTATGNGTISQSGGLIQAATLTMSSGSGSIGSSLPTAISTRAGTLSLHTAGAAFINNQPAVTLAASTVGSATVAASQLNLVSANVITTAGAISAPAINLSSSLSSGPGIVVGAGSTLNATAASKSAITLTAAGVTVGGTINGSTGTVTLDTNNTATPITVGSSGSGFNVSPAALSNIKAGTLVIGSTADTGTLTVTSNLNLSGPYNLQLLNGAGIDTTAGTMTIGARMLSITSSGGLINLGAISGTSGSVTISNQGTATTGIELNGLVAAATVNLSSTQSGIAFGNGTADGVAKGTTSVTVTALGPSSNITSSNTVLDAISSPAVKLQAGNNVVSLGVVNPQSKAGPVSLTVTAGHDATVIGEGQINFMNASSAVHNLDVFANAGGSGGNMTMTAGATVSAGNQLRLDLPGAANLTQAGATVTLTSPTVIISGNSGTFGSGAAPIKIGTSNLTASTTGTGSVFVSNAGDVTLTGANTAGGQFSLTSAGNVKIGSGATVSAGRSVSLTDTLPSSSIAQLDAGGITTLFSPSIVLKAGLGIGAPGNEITVAASRSPAGASETVALTANSGAGVSVVATNSAATGTIENLNLTGASSAGAASTFSASTSGTEAGSIKLVSGASVTASGGTIDLTAASGGNILQQAAGTTLTAGAVNLSVAGADNSIGTGGTGGVAIGITNGTHAVNLTASTGTGVSGTGSIFVASAGSVNITGNLSAGGQLSLITTGAGANVTIGSGAAILAGGAASIKAAGSITQADNTGLIAAQPLSLIAGAGGIGSGGQALVVDGSGDNPEQLTVQSGGMANVSGAAGLSVASASATGALTLTALSGTVVSSGTISGASVALNSIGPSPGVNLGGNVTASGASGVTIDTGGVAGDAPGKSITSTAGFVAITASNLAFGGTGNGAINAGARTVTLTPAASSQTIGVGSAGGSFAVTGSVLKAITAGTLVIGSTSNTGGTAVAGTLSVGGSGAGAYNLTFDTGGAFDASLATINFGARTVTVDQGISKATVTTGAAAGTTGTFEVAAGAGITVGEPILVGAGGHVSLSTPSGAVSLGSNVGGTGAVVVINNTSTASTDGITGSGVVIGGNVRLTTAGGAIENSGATPLNTQASTLSVVSAGNAMISNTGALTLANSSAGATQGLRVTASGNIAVSGTVGSSGSSVALNASSSGSISTVGTGVIEGNATLSSAGGNIGTLAAPLKTAATSLTASTTGSGSVVVNNNNSSGLTVAGANASGSGAFQITENGPLSVTGSITTNAPTTASTGLLKLVQTNGTQPLTVNDNLTANGGSIVIQNQNASGSIVLGDGNTSVGISTNVVSSLTSANGQVSVFLGTTAPAQTGRKTSSWNNITITQSPAGAVYLGSNPPQVIGGTGGTASTAPTIILKNQNVLFNVPTTTMPGTITINKGVTITADPQAPVAGLSAPQVDNAPTATRAGSALPLAAPYEPAFHESYNWAVSPAPVSAPPNASAPAASNTNVTTATVQIGPGIPGGAGGTPALESGKDARAPGIGQVGSPAPEEFDPENIILFDGLSIRTDEQIAPNAAKLPVEGTGEIGPSYDAIPAAGARHASPASCLQQISYVVPSAVLPVSHQEDSYTNAGGACPAPTGFNPPRQRRYGVQLTSGVDAGVGVNGTTVELRRGSVLFMPNKAMTVETNFGCVSIAAGSVVLVTALHNGVAIYDLHDGRSGDVRFSMPAHTVCLAPGHHILVTRQGAAGYEQVNPLASIGHRKLQMYDCGLGTRQFSSEFSIVSALNGLRLLTRMKHSQNPHDVQVLQQLMKNAAIIQMTRTNSGAFRRLGTSRSYATAVAAQR